MDEAGFARVAGCAVPLLSFCLRTRRVRRSDQPTFVRGAAISFSCERRRKICKQTMKDTDEKSGPPRRYVYVGVIDSSGSGALLFPLPGQGNQGNRLPLLEQGPDGKARLPQEFPLTRLPADLEITPPAGIDHYFMLVSATALSTPEVLQFEGAYQPDTEGRRGLDDDDPLTHLLRARGNTRSAAPPPSPGNWDIQHFYIRSVLKDGAAN